MASVSGALSITALCLLCSLGPCTAADWGYSGPEGPGHWNDHFPICGKDKQSPIDIVTSSVMYDKNLGAITFSGYDKSDQTFTLKNTGHGVQVDITGGTPIEMSGGGLPGTFKLLQFHFHWGTTNSQGSEHLLNGKQFPMEVHLVNYNTKYSDFNEAKPQPDGLAVIGAFFEIGNSENKYIKYIVDNLNNIGNKDQSTSITTFSMNNLLPSKASYFRYFGSLTTPTCDESITWTVLDDTIKISQTQMDAFRSGLYEGNSDSEPIEFNYRPPQDLNGRTVKSNFEVSAASHVTGHVTSALVVMVISTFV